VLELVLDHEVLDLGALRQDHPEETRSSGVSHWPVPEVVDETPLGLLARDTKVS
jgi:hypothetical protein